MKTLNKNEIVNGVDAVCFRTQSEIEGGIVTKANELGVEFKAHVTTALPRFAPGSMIHLQLQLPQTRETVSIPAILTGARLKRGQWHYRFIWPDDLPENLGDRYYTVLTYLLAHFQANQVPDSFAEKCFA